MPRTQVTLSPPSDLIERVMEAAAALQVPMVKIWEVSCRRFLDTDAIKKALAAHRAKETAE